jgi:endonuclease/exonuclease/phosphatase family metal-dependent hydrolase
VIQAANFDNGGEGVAYHDTGTGNAGGAYRQTGVDLAASSEGGYTIGWISPGEWVNYAVNVSASGAYTAQIRVAAPSAGGTLHIGFNASSGSWTQASVPATGGWQTWTTVNVPLTLTAGTQTMTLTFDTGGYNVSYVQMVSGGGGTPPPSGSAPAEPNSPNVPPGTAGVTVTPNLSWKSAGATSYDVYLGTANPPALAISNISNYWWAPTPALAAGTNYKWQVIAKNASGSTPGPIWTFTTAGGVTTPPPPPPPPPSGTGRLRVMTWNIHGGFDASNSYVLAQQVSFMAAQNVDVIVLQEVQTWDENQPTRIPALIQQVSGQTWYSVWVPGTGCLTSAGCAGDLMLSRLPIAASSTSFTGLSGMGRVLVNVGGIPVNIVDIHLEYYDTNLRTTELLGMMTWARSFGGPRLVGGDFNSWWGEYWIGQMKTEYSDTWLDVTGNQDGGYTTGNVRFDYWFRAFDNAGRLTPLTCSVPYTALSDHRPVVAEYAVQ